MYQTRQLESVNKFYEPQNRAKINLFETKTNVLLCFEVCLLVLTYPRKENTSDLIYLSYFALCYLQCFVLIVSSSVCLQCIYCRRSPTSVPLCSSLSLSFRCLACNAKNPERNLKIIYFTCLVMSMYQTIAECFRDKHSSSAPLDTRLNIFAIFSLWHSLTQTCN